MIRKPGAPDLYGYFEGKEQMPPFGPEQLTDNDVAMVIRFLRNDYPMPDRPAGTKCYRLAGCLAVCSQSSLETRRPGWDWAAAW